MNKAMVEAESATYLVGKSVQALKAPYCGEDSAFGAARLDGKCVDGGDFSHCTFANVSFKEVVLQHSRFLDCVFVGCYFRRAQLKDTTFTGCRFIDCNFNHVSVMSCDFKHSTFRGCQLAFSELQHSLPSEPNLREELARNLCLESSRLGLSSEARMYRMEEIRAREEHLRSALLGRSQWYREHFDVFARFGAGAQLSLSFINRWLWGYGEQAWILVRNLIVLAFFVFPFSFYLLRGGLVRTSGNGEVHLVDFIYFSLQNMLPAGIESGLTAVSFAPRMLAGLESAFAVVTLGLFTSYVLRWSLHR